MENRMTPNEKLFEGVRSVDIEKINEALQEGANINTTEPITINKPAGFTPLHVAATMYGKNNIAVVQHLLKCGASVEARNESSKSTALHYATGDVLKFLLENKADIEALDHTDFTPLHYAVYYNNPEKVKILLASGANTEARTGIYDSKHHYRLTPLEMAWSMQRDSEDRLEIIKLLTDYKIRLNPHVLNEQLKSQQEETTLLKTQVKTLETTVEELQAKIEKLTLKFQDIASTNKLVEQSQSEEKRPYTNAFFNE